MPGQYLGNLSECSLLARYRLVGKEVWKRVLSCVCKKAGKGQPWQEAMYKPASRNSEAKHVSGA